MHQVCRQMSVGALGLQTEDCGSIGSADGGPLGSSGLNTEVCGDIDYGDRGLQGYALQTESAGASGQQT